MLLLLLSCRPDDVPDQESPDEILVPPEPLHFDGVQTLTWDGSRIVAAWSAATGEEPITYEVVVGARDGAEVRHAVEGTSLELPGLDEGEYEVRVEATDALGDSLGGDVTLTQLAGQNRLVYRSEVPLRGAADVWGQDDVLVLAGRDSGVSWMVVDASEPELPTVLEVRYDAGFVKDIKIADGLMFTNGECGCKTDSAEWAAYDRIGVRIFDFSEPSNPTLLGTIGGDEGASSVHNVSVSSGVVYVADNEADAVGIYSVEDPTAPVHLGDWLPPRAFVHDMAVLDDKLYVAFWAGFAIVDVSDPSKPVDEVVHLRDGGSALHNIWPSQDGTHVFTTDEQPGGHLRIYDVQDPDEVVEVAAFAPNPTHVIHNAHVRGDFAYISYYIDGVYVLDVSEPANPELVGWYDTYESDFDTGHAHDTAQPDEEHGHNSRLYDGAWGVWPYGDHVAVGDMQRGLILVDHVPDVVEAPAHEHE